MGSSSRVAKVADIVGSARRLEPLGWSLRPVKGGHRIINPEGKGVTIHTSGGSDWRTGPNTAADLRALGFDEALRTLARTAETNRQATLQAVQDAGEAALFEAEQAATAPSGAPAPAVAFSSTASDDIPRPSGVRGLITRTETITPERAAELVSRPLTARTSDGALLTQRKIKPKQVDKLVGIIKASEWKLTPDGLSIAPDGSILNGQHRLRAIAQAGIPVDVRVTYNVDPDTFAAIDTNVVRGTADALTMHGGWKSGNATTASSALKLLTCYHEMMERPTSARPWRTWNATPMSNDSIVAAAKRWPELGEHLRVAHNTATPSKLIAASLTAFRQISAEAWPAGIEVLDNFCDDLRPDKQERILTKGNAALTLRNWAARPAAKAVTSRRETQLLLLLRHFRAYAAGKPLGAVILHDDDTMPKPYVPTTRARKAAA